MAKFRVLTVTVLVCVVEGAAAQSPRTAAGRGGGSNAIVGICNPS
jgi:hypothetical protein